MWQILQPFQLLGPLQIPEIFEIFEIEQDPPRVGGDVGGPGWGNQMESMDWLADWPGLGSVQQPERC